MSAERWRRVEELFHFARERAPEHRAAFLSETCDGDDELRREVESLLSHADSGEGLMDRPAREAADPLQTDTLDQAGWLAGRRISRYEILYKLGEGGMGVVYQARDTRLGRLVAIKVVNARFTNRFEREARAIAALNHPHICTLHDVGEHEGVPYLVMEYVEGKLLHGPLPTGEALRYAIQVCEALAAAHKAGIVHCDLKPDNILLTAEGSVKVLDFGLAKLQPGSAPGGPTPSTVTERGTIAGTAAYMSPEQAQGEPVDARSDIFSFGAVLYELLSGRRAFRGETLRATLAAVIAGEPSPLGEAPPEVARIVGKMLAKERASRYQSAEELLADLRAAERPGAWALSQRAWIAPAAERRRKRPTRRSRIRSLVVLPLVNLSRDAEQEYLADGMTEALISDLAKLRVLKVISRFSAMRYKGTAKSLTQIAEELDVDAVVGGSVLRAGQRVRISAQIIDPATDMHLWAESYERDIQDVLVLQNEVAQAIAQQIKVVVTPEASKHLTNARRVNPEAYESYLRGRSHWYRFSREHLDMALEYFQKSLEKDPHFALAHVGVADTWMIRGDIGLMPPLDAFPRAMVAALKALELDDTLPEVHSTLANLRLGQWDWAGADAEFRKAIQLNPSDSAAHFFYSDLLIMVGRPEEAQAEMERALELDPLNTLFQCFLGWHLVYLRRYDDAITQLRKALGMEPNFSSAHMGLWGAFFVKREYEDALAEARKFFAVLGDHEIVEVLAGGTTEADYAAAMRSAAEKLAGRASHAHVPAIRVARLYAHAGERDRALDWLEKAYAQGNPPLSHLKVAWDWDVLRAEPRFRDLVRRMNFPVS